MHVCVCVCVCDHVTMSLEVSDAAVCYLKTIVLWGAVGSKIRFPVFKTLCEAADIHTIKKTIKISNESFCLGSAVISKVRRSICH